MSQLRKEYKEFKQFHEDIFKEAAEAWTEENVILINERLNRNAIYRLNSAIERFDNKFGKYKEQLPAIADILNKAENGLHLVINGKVGSRSTALMLQRMSIIYNILSSFFGGDLGALLKTPAFRIAHEKPDEKIDKIIDHGHDVKAIRRNLAAALKPSEEERTIFRRAFKSFDMPNLDWNMAAKQLCCLSCNELKDLTGVEKIPMVVVDVDESEKETVADAGEGVVEAGAGVARAYNRASGTIARGANVAAQYGIPLAGAAVGAGVTAAGTGISAIIDRFKSRSKEMTVAINKLEKYVSGVEGFENIDKALGQLRDKSKTAANAKFDTAGGVRGLFKHPSVIVMKQAIMATEAIEAVLKAWNEHIKETYKGGIKQEDLPKIKKELEKRVKGGVFSRIKGAVSGVKPFPGLSSDDIINAVMNVAGIGITGGEAQPPSGAGPAQGAAPGAGVTETIIQEALLKRFNSRNLQLENVYKSINAFMLTEDYADLQRLVTQIGTFEKTDSGKVEDALTKDIESVQKTGKVPGAPKTSQTTQPKQQGAAKGETTNVQPPTTPQQAVKAAQEITKEAEGTAEQDPGFELQDLNVLNTSIDVLNKSLSNPLNADLLKSVNAQIAALQVPGVSDYNTARDFITQYQSIISEPNLQNTQKAVATVIATINKYPEYEVDLSGLQESKNKKANERRQLLVEKIKQIILEQLEEAQVAPAGDGQPVQATPSTASGTATGAASPGQIMPTVEVKQEQTVIIDDDVIKQYVTAVNKLNSMTVQQRTSLESSISQAIAQYQIPNVNNLQTFTNYITTYQSIMTNAKNLRKILSIVNKTANVVSKTPVVAPTQRA